MQVFLTALISALTSIIVVVLSHVLSTQRAARQTEEAEREMINMKYLNPLRLHLAENQLRLSEILSKIDGGQTCPQLLTVDSASELSEKDAEWFNGRGTYLVSSAYLTACLFAQMLKLREDHPYLRLGSGQDTQLLAVILQVHRAFRRDLNIYYATQPSIGEDMLVRSESRLRSYREFCESLRIPEKRVWMDRLIQFYLNAGHGKKLENIKEAVAAIEKFSNFLDAAVGGGESIRARMELERPSSLWRVIREPRARVCIAMDVEPSI
jgi:hypothetical protein